jgi:hypothetical protein
MIEQLHRMRKRIALHEQRQLASNTFEFKLGLAHLSVVKYALDYARTGEPKLEIRTLDMGMFAKEPFEISRSENIAGAYNERSQRTDDLILIARCQFDRRNDNISGGRKLLDFWPFAIAQMREKLAEA